MTERLQVRFSSEFAGIRIRGTLNAVIFVIQHDVIGYLAQFIKDYHLLQC